MDQVLAQYRIVDKSFTRNTNKEKRRYWHLKVMKQAVAAANGQVTKSQAKQAIATTYFRYGYIDFIHGRFKQARKYFFKSISLNAVHTLKSIIYIGLSYFPFLTKKIRQKNVITTI